MHRHIRLLALALAFSFAVLAVGPAARAQMDRPAWTGGDFWEYQVTGNQFGLSSTGTVRMTVQGADTITVGGASYASVRVNVTANLTQGGARFESGDMWVRASDLAPVRVAFRLAVDVPFIGTTTLATTVSYDPPPRVEWPLAPGRAWSASSAVTVVIQTSGLPPATNTVSLTNSYTVLASTPVTVPAGTFETTPVRASNAQGSEVDYWSPQAGSYVRRETYDSNNVRQSSAELTSYRYSAAGFLGLPLAFWFLFAVLILIVVVAVVLRRRRQKGVIVPPGPVPESQPPAQPPAL